MLNRTSESMKVGGKGTCSGVRGTWKTHKIQLVSDIIAACATDRWQYITKENTSTEKQGRHRKRWRGKRQGIKTLGNSK